MTTDKPWPHCPKCDLPMSDWFVTHEGGPRYCYPCGPILGDGKITEDQAVWKPRFDERVWEEKWGDYFRGLAARLGGSGHNGR
jgi:hypothetical protein